MKTFILTFDMGNAAFDDDARVEVARILQTAANSIDDRGLPSEGHETTLRDINGNRIGFYKITNETAE
jgi:hypothetical protein